MTAGTAKLPFETDTVNPKFVEAPGPRLLFELVGRMIMRLACGQVGFPFQVAVITCPEFMVTVEVQLVIAELPAVMVTWPLKPLLHRRVWA